MSQTLEQPHIYEGDGDRLMEQPDSGDRILLLPGPTQHERGPDQIERMRIMWGQRLIDDLLANRYNSLVCAVNANDNSHGIISQLAKVLPTSQWDNASITEHARHHVREKTMSVVKYDMDAVEVLALLRPAHHEHLMLEDIKAGFKMVSAMIARKPHRLPSASVLFLGARANRLIDEDGSEPCMERVLGAMYDGDYRGDAYPANWSWESAPTGVFAGYPFPDSVKRMQEGGF